MLADLPVVQILQMIELDDLGLAPAQMLQHPRDFFRRGDRFRRALTIFTKIRAVRLRMAQLGLTLTLDHFLHANPTCNNGEIGRQRAFPSESAEDIIILVDDLQENLGGDILNVSLGEHEAARVGNMMNDVVNQAHVTINEIVPGPGFLPQATVEKLSINVAQGHWRASSHSSRRVEDADRPRRERRSRRHAATRRLFFYFTTGNRNGKRHSSQDSMPA